mmetsp:Transcript_17855/g.54384  ORF Transcript_17855/g.54384 Transcript_17855/m.54384 type:complete len:91 (+) Transcript_17855:301-573(+)
MSLNASLAVALVSKPGRTRFDPSVYIKPRCAATPPDFDLNAGNDLLEAEAIMEDVLKRRRRVLGPAHPDTRHSERYLSRLRAQLAQLADA